MGAQALLSRLAEAGIAVRADGGILKAGPSERLNDEYRRLIREHKPELLEVLRHKTTTPETPETPGNGCELRRAKVLADLRKNPGITYAADVDGTGDPVTIMLAIRDVGSCILEVDVERWDPFQFLALLERPRVELGAVA